LPDRPAIPRKTTQLKSEVAAYKRRRIVEEASHLFFADGYEATTLDAVADQLHVTKPFIYSYYRNKSELLSEICQTGIQLSLTALDEALAVEGTAHEQLKMVVERVARIIIENQKYISVYISEEKSLDPDDARRIRELRHRFDSQLAALLARGKAQGEFEFEDASRTAIWVSGVLSWIANWYHDGGRWSATEVVMDAISIVMKIVSKRPDPLV
jgi:AcrR family transcriptional regulator